MCGASMPLKFYKTKSYRTITQLRKATLFLVYNNTQLHMTKVMAVTRQTSFISLKSIKRARLCSHGSASGSDNDYDDFVSVYDSDTGQDHDHDHDIGLL